jgi:hypothetical protein
MSGIPFQRVTHMHHAFAPGVENEEPVAVVRVVADLFMALSLCFMMATTAARSGAPAAVDATPGQSGHGASGKYELKVTLVGEDRFVLGTDVDGTPMSGTEVIAHLNSTNRTVPQSILVRFSPKLPAVALHTALLGLQRASGTHPIALRSLPASE